jgi:hypothetical protein
MYLSISLKVLLETFEKYKLTNLINLHRINNISTILSTLKYFLNRPLDPLIAIRHITDISFVNEKHTCSGDCGGSGISEIGDFEKKSHVSGKGNTFIGD